MTGDACGFRIRYYELNLSNFTFKYSGLFLLVRTYYNSPSKVNSSVPRWEGPSARVWGVNGCVGKSLFLEAIAEVGKQSKGRGVLQKHIDVDVVD